jgi:hypothetical protein
MEVWDFEPGDQIAYLNPWKTSRFIKELRGEVVKVFNTKVRIRVTNVNGKEAVKDVRPGMLRKIDSDS